MKRAEGRGPGAEGEGGERTLRAEQSTGHADVLLNFGAYRKAHELFDQVVEDTGELVTAQHLCRLVSQQLASADSIASNMEEGYGRGSRREYIRFLIISRGSARETAGRYWRLRHWLGEETATRRIKLCDEIIAILSSSILSLRKGETTSKPPSS